MPHDECADRDVARSYERLDRSDLARLGRAARAELEAFFARNPHLAGWRDRVRIIALAQGAAEHYLRGRRGVRDLDVIVCFAEDSRLPPLFRRMSSPGIGVPPNSGAARTTRRNIPAALSMSPSGSSRTAPARSLGCKSGWPDGRQDGSIPSDIPTSPTSQWFSSILTLDQSPGTQARLLRPGPRQQDTASPMAWCRLKALRLTHRVRAALAG